jgi:serine/threonine protein kinase
VTQEFSSVVGSFAPGDQIAGYQIAQQIGTGGMAVVYRALDLRLDRPVALKVLAPRLAEDDAFRQRFIRESRAAAGVDHPHIIPVFDAGDAGGVLFIAMRYVSGGDVRSLIQSEGRISPGRATAIAAQAASALDAAHAHGLVHRDVKPGNILLDSAGGRDHVYLADFGLSKHSLAANTLTATGQFMGTLDYVSPEQIQGQRADGRADQYALACTIVEMLSGRPPYKRDESMALLWAQLEAPPPLLTELRPDLPPEVNEVMRTALAKLPADRYPTCTAFTSALAAACAARHVLRQPTELAAAIPADFPAPAAGGPPAAVPPAAVPSLAVPSAAVPPSPAPPSPAPPSDVPSPAVPDGPGLTRPEPIPVLNRPGQQGFAPAQSPPASRTAAPHLPPRSPAPRPAQPSAARPPAPNPLDGLALGPAHLAGGDRITPPMRQHAGPPPVRREPHLVPQRPAARRRRAGKAVAAAVGVAVIAGAGVAAYVLSHRTHSGHPTTVYTTVTVPPASALLPAQTVQAYFAAINARNYERAWELDSVVHNNQDYQQFVSGYSDTKRDAITILTTNGNVVSARLVATQADGTVKTFQGSYTVTNGKITGTSVQQVSG